jgi:MOSC domain-containing protein YiiM
VAEQVLSLNVGRPTQVPYRGNIISTAIFKHPVEGRLMLRTTGFNGDGQADPSVHGGEHKAAYVYSADDYAWWMSELGHPLQHGEFGENLTVTGLRDADVSVGDVLRIGEALVQVASPREPCFKLGIRMGDARFQARFREADRMGFYVRILEEGEIGVGDGAEVVERAKGSVTIAEFHRVIVDGRDDPDALRRLAAAPTLEPEWIDWCERRLADAAKGES